MNATTQLTVAGRVIAAFGRHYTVELADLTTRQCYPRGKKGNAAVGDFVSVILDGNEPGVIEKIEPRRNLLYRSDELKSKQFAANVDQLLIVVATEPAFQLELIGRALAGAWSIGITPIVLLNKIDRLDKLAAARAQLLPLQGLGVQIIEVCATDSVQIHTQLAPLLQNKVSLFLGQSGMGKSTLLNALVPDALAATQAYSEALGAGKHTTTSTRLYHLPSHLGQGDLIDSPGFQAFGLQHLSTEEIERGFPEFKPYAEQCKFYNCKHKHEPGCAVLNALEQGLIFKERHDLFSKLIDELANAKRY